MRKADYQILAAAIKRHGVERTEGEAGASYHYSSAEAAKGARQCAEAIAGTFVRFASVDREAFLKACGVT